MSDLRCLISGIQRKLNKLFFITFKKILIQISTVSQILDIKYLIHATGTASPSCSLRFFRFVPRPLNISSVSDFFEDFRGSSQSGS